MHRFTQCIEIWKKNPKFSHSHMSLSKCWNCVSITVMNFLSYHTYTTQSFRKLFHKNWTSIIILFELSFILLKTIDTWFKKWTIQTITPLNKFAFIFCVDLVTLESLWCHKGVIMHVTYKTMHRFSTMHDSPPPALELHLQLSAS